MSKKSNKICDICDAIIVIDSSNYVKNRDVKVDKDNFIEFLNAL